MDVIESAHVVQASQRFAVIRFVDALEINRRSSFNPFKRDSPLTLCFQAFRVLHDQDGIMRSAVKRENCCCPYQCFNSGSTRAITGLIERCALDHCVTAEYAAA
jgi:hypothetical protein